MTMCGKVENDCKVRNENLNKVVIWNKIVKEDLTQLSAKADEESTMRDFYDKYMSGCTTWYKNVLNAYQKDSNHFQHVVK